MSINIEEIIGLIVKEVVKELSKRGIDIGALSEHKNLSAEPVKTPVIERIELDIKGYKTPILTERMLETVEPEVKEIVVPCGTVLTPGAREIIKRRKLQVIK